MDNKRKIFFYFATFLIFSCFCISLTQKPANAAELETLITPIAKEYLGPGKPIYGASVGIVRGDEIGRFGFGRVSENDESVPDEKTVYEIASISKVFTGTLLAEMAARKELGLDDALEDFLPEGISVAKISERRMTLRDIATHRSGLPRLPENFWEIAAESPEDPYVPFTVPALFESLDKCKPQREPGKAYEYSNFGFAVLGTVLARCKETTYEKLLYERVLRPIGMESTKMDIDDSMKKRLAPGHDADHKQVKNWYLNAFAGGGGLRSDIDDMLKFAQAALRKNEAVKAGPELEKAFENALARHSPMDDKQQQQPMGLGWHIAGDGTRVHNGQTAGYCSIMIIDRERKIAVIVLTNSHSDKANALGNDIYRALRGAK